jgi:hypothetical protein
LLGEDWRAQEARARRLYSAGNAPLMLLMMIGARKTIPRIAITMTKKMMSAYSSIL